MTFDPALEQRLTAFTEHHCLLAKNQTIIIGFSGGPDSLFLLHWLTKLQSNLQLSLVAAHLDHGWREDSSNDTQWCKQVAQDLGVTFVSEKTSSTPSKNSGSQEELGRRLRRDFFNRVAQQYENSIIALGHHSDDQQETFFIRLLRGAGVAGLAGIKARDKNIIHPLLCITKQEIITTLEENGIAYLLDPTNQSDQFLRNRIRMNVIPALRQCDARFDDSLARTMENLRATDDFVTEQTKLLFEGISKKIDGALWLDYTILFEQHPFMQKQLLLHWLITEKVQFTPSKALFDEMTRFLQNNKSNEHIFYQSWKMVKKGNSLCCIARNISLQS